MRVFVTGGAGFVGSVLVPMMLDRGWRVRVYDNLLYGVRGLLSCFLRKDFELVKGDVRNKKQLQKAVEGCDAVVHLAALVGYPVCKKDENAAVTTNVGGTVALCEALDEKTPLVFASTGSCYGNLEGVCKEELPLKPLTIYGQTKALAEEAVMQRNNYVIYRFATGYGVSSRLRLDLLINDFCYKAVREHNLIVYERHFQRTFIHVQDMARAFMFALENFDRMKGEVYNVGSEDMNLTKQYVAEFIRERVPFYLHYADVGHDEDRRDYAVSYKKIREVGWSAKTTLEEGVEQLINLFRVFRVEHDYTNV